MTCEEWKLRPNPEDICNNVLPNLEKLLIPILYKQRAKSSIWKQKVEVPGLRLPMVIGKGLWINHNKHTKKLLKSAKWNGPSGWIWSLISCVLFWDLNSSSEKACFLSTLDEKTVDLDMVSEVSYKDRKLLVQWLRDNVTWCTWARAGERGENQRAFQFSSASS